jgi:hypothetical protein
MIPRIITGIKWCLKKLMGRPAAIDPTVQPTSVPMIMATMTTNKIDNGFAGLKRDRPIKLNEQMEMPIDWETMKFSTNPPPNLMPVKTRAMKVLKSTV